MARRRRRHNRRVVAHRRRRANVYRRRRRSNLFGFKRRRHYSRRRHNPGVVRRVRRHRRYSRRRHNPGFGLRTGLVTQAVWGIAGLVGTRMLPNLVPQYNTGVMGYVLNIIAGIGLTMVGKKIAGSQASNAIAFGSAMGIVARILTDYSPLGKYIGMQGLRGDLGIFQPTTFFVPLGASSNADGNVMTMPGAVQALAASKKGVSGLAGSRYGAGASRYA